MHSPVRIGAMIHRNRAALAKCDAQLAEIAEMMPHAGGDRRRQLRRLAREVKWVRLRLRFAGWLLIRLDPR